MSREHIARAIGVSYVTYPMPKGRGFTAIFDKTLICLHIITAFLV